MRELVTKYTRKLVKSPIKAYLQRHSFQVSQAGQDLWVFGEVFNEKRGGYFLDVGAYDGIFISNTYLLERKYHWTGICVEANPDSFELLRKNRRAICVHACLDSTGGFANFAKRGVLGGIVSSETDNDNKDTENNADEIIQIETKTLERVLIENQAPSEIDYLSVDIEGAEQRVFGNFNFKKYRFKCMTIERPTEMLRKIFKENGYILIKEIPNLDCFYLHESISKQYLATLIAFYDKQRWRVLRCGRHPGRLPAPPDAQPTLHFGS